MPVSESYLQGKIVKYLKSRGCYVIKTTPGPGVPVGCPDIIALKDGFWLALEVKASPKARFQPLQKQTIALLDEMSYARAVDPTNWPAIMLELDELLK